MVSPKASLSRNALASAAWGPDSSGGTTGCAMRSPIGLRAFASRRSRCRSSASLVGASLWMRDPSKMSSTCFCFSLAGAFALTFR